MLERLLDSLIGSDAFERLLTDRARPVLARADAGEDFVVSALVRALEAPVMVVAAGPREAEPLVRGAKAWLGADRVAYLPPWEALPYEGISPSPEVAARRADAVRRLRGAEGPFVVVTTGLAAMHGTPPTLGVAPPLELVAGDELPPDLLADRLVALGYLRSDVIEHRGEFAVRGGVVDVYPGT
ncbi:MAG: transcription-repair coupling factor, partial [Actinomycetota bacterium]